MLGEVADAQWMFQISTTNKSANDHHSPSVYFSVHMQFFDKKKIIILDFTRTVIFFTKIIKIIK